MAAVVFFSHVKWCCMQAAMRKKWPDMFTMQTDVVGTSVKKLIKWNEFYVTDNGLNTVAWNIVIFFLFSTDRQLTSFQN